MRAGMIRAVAGRIHVRIRRAAELVDDDAIRALDTGGHGQLVRGRDAHADHDDIRGILPSVSHRQRPRRYPDRRSGRPARRLGRCTRCSHRDAHVRLRRTPTPRAGHPVHHPIAASSTVTSTPSSRQLAATSSPMYPPPTITAGGRAPTSAGSDPRPRCFAGSARQPGRPRAA